jgi:hypothetical protein
MKRRWLYIVALSIGSFALFVFLVFLVWLSKASVAERFKSDRQMYGELVRQWQNTPNLQYVSNSYWSKGLFVWNETHITEIEHQYEVFDPDKGKIKVKSLDEAAAVAGTTADEIQRWKNIMHRLGITSISTIATAHPVQEQYIQIDIDNGWRSAFTIIGFIYIPEGHDQPYKSFLAYISEKEAPPHYKKMVPIEGRWFYFEAKN